MRDDKNLGIATLWITILCTFQQWRGLRGDFGKSKPGNPAPWNTVYHQERQKMEDEMKEQYPGVSDMAERVAQNLLDMADEVFADVFVPYANRLIKDGYLEFDLSFPVEWRFGDDPSDGMGGPAPDDAGTIQVLMDYCGGDLVLVGSTSLNEMVNQCLEMWASPNAKTHEDFFEASNALSAALRAAADRLDAALPE